MLHILEFLFQYRWKNSDIEREMDLVKNVVSEIRSIRRLLGLTKAKCPCKYRLR